MIEIIAEPCLTMDSTTIGVSLDGDLKIHA
jgi:hypothetical protein